MAEQKRSGSWLSMITLVVAMELATSCASAASASGPPVFSGEWAYAKKCDSGHYLSLSLRQRAGRVTGDWSEGTHARGSDGYLRGEVRGDTLYVRYCSDDGGAGYSICPTFAPPEDQFRIEAGLLVRYQKYGADYRRSVALHPDIAGRAVPFDQQCTDSADGQ